MQNTIPCPSCGRQLRVPDDLLGKLVKCPACSQTFTANLSEPTPAAESEAQPEAYRPASSPPPLEDYSPESPAAGEEEDYEPRPVRTGRRRRFQTEHRGAMVLTLGILSIVICGFLGPVAWVMGNNDLAAMRAGRMDNSGEGLTQAGRILGIISSIMLILGCVMACLGFAMSGFMGAAGGGRKF
jgi:predicted Zn finger-like uncharacterized protein